MKEFVEYVIGSLIDNPEQLTVNEVVSSNVIIYEIEVPKEDRGKIIGKKGATIDAIRTLIYILAAKNQMRVNLHLVE